MPIDTSMYQNLVPAQPPGNAFERFMGRQQKQADFATKQQESQQAQQKLAQEQAAQAAMLRLSNPETAQGFQPTNYAEVQAMQAHAKQMSDQFAPMITSAVQNKNPELLKKIAETYRSSGNPALAKFADTLDSVKLLDKNKYKVRYKFENQAEIDAARQKMPGLANHPQLSPGLEYEFDVTGAWGSPDTVVNSAEPVKVEKVEKEKPRFSNTSFRTKAGLDGIIARIPKDAPNREALAASFTQAFKDMPAGGRVKVNLKDGVPIDEVDYEGGTAAAGAGGAGVTELTEKARKMLAIASQKGITVPLPSRLNVNEKTKVLNELAARLPDSEAAMEDAVSVAGLSQASRKATTMELTKLKAQRGQIMAFARSAELGFKRAAELVDKVPDSAIPLLNKAIRAGAKSIAGDPATTNLFAQLHFATNEFSKVTTSATGAGSQGSQKDRDAIAEIFSHGSTKEQIKSLLLNVIEKDLAYRKQGYDEAIEAGEMSLRESSGTESAGGKAKAGSTLKGGIVPRRPGESVADYLKRVKK